MMNARTGKTISVDAHIAQSIHDILTTTPGERVMQPRYGCDLKQFLGQTLTPRLSVQIASAVAKALRDFEPRINVERVQSVANAGALTLAIIYTHDNAQRETQVTTR
jgi:phage baseplate assembly protein W